MLRAFGPTFINKVVQQNLDALMSEGLDQDPYLTMKSDRDHHEAALGRRLKRTVAMLRTPSFARNLDILATALYPCNYVMAYLLSANSDRTANRFKAPSESPIPLLDFTNDEYSPVVIARQAYADVLRSAAPEGRCRCISQLKSASGIDLTTLEITLRMAVLADSSLFMRVDQEFASDQYVPLACTDQRVPLAVREEKAAWWASLQSHCREQYASLPLARICAKLSTGSPSGVLTAAAV